MNDIVNPYGALLNEIYESLSKPLSALGVTFDDIVITKPPSREYGDISVSVFNLAKKFSVKPEKLAKGLVDELKITKEGLIFSVQAVRGFINFKINRAKYFNLIFNVINKLRDKYGYNPVEVPLKVIIEHTSVTPVKPMHIGHLRNALLGDSLARLFRFRGHKVETHFYINDVGLQVAYAAYAYRYARDLRSAAKADHWIGAMYSVINALTEIISLRNRYNEIKDKNIEEARMLLKKIDEWMATLARFKEKYPELVERLLTIIEKVENPLDEIYKLNRDYEKGELYAVKLVKEVSKKCLEGYRETLGKLNIDFDSWDWESLLTVWNNFVYELINKLSETGYVVREDGALVLLADQVVKDFNLYDVLGIPKGYEVPKFVLMRSDGTTLYATRDVAYTIWKMKRADLVVNVIGVEQKLEQLQVKISLWLLGYKTQLKKIIHHAYEVVNIVGGKLSGRRGRYITVDELIDESIKRAYKEIKKRNRNVTESEAMSIAKIVGIGAIKYAFLSVTPTRPLSFDWNRVLDFTRNSGPFIQYAYTRAKSILRKSKVKDPLSCDFNPSLLKENLEIELVEHIGEFPEIVAKAADNLRVDLIASFTNRIATIFNSFYDKYPVLSARSNELKAARLAMTQAFCITMKNALNILGIQAPEKM